MIDKVNEESEYKNNEARAGTDFGYLGWRQFKRCTWLRTLRIVYTDPGCNSFSSHPLVLVQPGWHYNVMPRRMREN